MLETLIRRHWIIPTSEWRNIGMHLVPSSCGYYFIGCCLISNKTGYTCIDLWNCDLSCQYKKNGGNPRWQINSALIAKIVFFFFFFSNNRFASCYKPEKSIRLFFHNRNNRFWFMKKCYTPSRPAGTASKVIPALHAQQLGPGISVDRTSKKARKQGVTETICTHKFSKFRQGLQYECIVSYVLLNWNPTSPMYIILIKFLYHAIRRLTNGIRLTHHGCFRPIQRWTIRPTPWNIETITSSNMTSTRTLYLRAI